MKITCISCQAKFNIPDEKLPRDKNAYIKCPKCHSSIKVPSYKVEAESRDVILSRMFQTQQLPEEEKKALVCISDAAALKHVTDTLKGNQYFLESPDNSASAIKLMAFYSFDVIVIDETFEEGGGFKSLMKEINALDLSLRRRTCVVLLSRKIKSGNRMIALNQSVNQVVNFSDIKQFEAYLMGTLNRDKHLYSVYRESMRATGRL